MWTASGSGDKRLPSNRLSNKSGPSPCTAQHWEQYQNITGSGDYSEGEGQWGKRWWPHDPKSHKNTKHKNKPLCVFRWYFFVAHTQTKMVCFYFFLFELTCNPSIHHKLGFNVGHTDDTDIWISDNSSAVFPSCLLSVCSYSCKEAVADLSAAGMTPPKVLIAPCAVVIFSDRKRRRGEIASIEKPEMELQEFKSMKEHFCGRMISLHICRHSPRMELCLQPCGRGLQWHQGIFSGNLWQES